MAELNRSCHIEVLLKKFSLDYGTITDHQNKVCIIIFIHDLPHLLFANVKVLCSFPDSQGILFPDGDFFRGSGLILNPPDP